MLSSQWVADDRPGGQFLKNRATDPHRLCKSRAGAEFGLARRSQQGAPSGSSARGGRSRAYAFRGEQSAGGESENLTQSREVALAHDRSPAIEQMSRCGILLRND